MLKFPCLCGHGFSLDDHLAGTQLQCPSCGRLVDVPTLGDLKNITPEGTYVLGLSPVAEEPARLSELHRTFASHKVDENGQDIDLRNTLEQVHAAGSEDIPLMTDADRARPAKPRYDPITGELIRPLALTGEESAVQREIPMATAVVNYASAGIAPALSSTRILYELLLPHNLVVLLFLAIFHLLIVASIIPLAIGFWFVAPLTFALLFGMIGHYSNVIQETGPAEMDEIPRPLRHASFGEDIWLPFVNMAVSFIICYGPSAVLLVYGARKPVLVLIAGAMALFGTFFFPATLLTAATSGTLVNLRPDRIWGVVRTAGRNYLAAVGSFVAGMGFYFAGLFAVVIRMFWRFSNFGSTLPGPHPLFIPNAYVGFGAVLLGMYLLHFACWRLGLIWRVHHADFPWASQRFVRSSSASTAEARVNARAAVHRKYELRQAERRALRAGRL